MTERITVRVHYELADGSEDSVVLSGTVEEIRKAADRKLAAVGGRNPWSEEIR